MSPEPVPGLLGSLGIVLSTTKVAAAPIPVRADTLPVECEHQSPAWPQPGWRNTRKGRAASTDMAHTSGTPCPLLTAPAQGGGGHWGWWHGDHEERGGNGPARPVSQELAAEQPSTASTRS